MMAQDEMKTGGKVQGSSWPASSGGLADNAGAGFAAQDARAEDPNNRWTQRFFSWPLFLLIAVLTPAAVVHSALNGKVSPLTLAAVTLAASLLCLIACGLATRTRLLPWLAACVVRPTGSAALWTWIAVGLVLRALTVALMLAPPLSDGSTYLDLASQLVHQHTYLDPRGDYAYWPPGYPFFLAPFVMLFGTGLLLIPILNMGLFVVAALAAAALARRFGQPQAATLAVALLALWPNLVVSTVTACKELVVMTLLLLVAVQYLAAMRGRSGNVLFSLGAGVALGFACLTQPSLMLFPAALLVHFLLNRELWSRWTMFLMLLFAMVAVIAPWTLRNYQVLGAFAPIATNGGDVFYRANNELATGGYIAKGSIDLRQYGEIERGKVGFEKGKEWIRNHPQDFAHLAVTKLALFQGDDSYGVYWGLKRAFGVEGLPYAVAKGTCVLAWVLMWALILCMLLRSHGARFAPDLTLVHFGYFYLLTIHAVFESDSRHHMPYFGWLVVAFAVMLSAWKHAQTSQLPAGGVRA